MRDREIGLKSLTFFVDWAFTNQKTEDAINKKLGGVELSPKDMGKIISVSKKRRSASVSVHYISKYHRGQLMCVK